MTLTPWSHVPIEDPKRPAKTPSNRRKITKEETTLFKGAYVGCTTDKLQIICGFKIEKVMYVKPYTRLFSHASRVWVEKLTKKSKTALGRQGKCSIRPIRCS